VKYVSGWTNITFTVCALFMNIVQRKALKVKASKGNGEGGKIKVKVKFTL
jgi:hypothetical protein